MDNQFLARHFTLPTIGETRMLCACGWERRGDGTLDDVAVLWAQHVNNDHAQWMRWGYPNLDLWFKRKDDDMHSIAGIRSANAAPAGAPTATIAPGLAALRRGVAEWRAYCADDYDTNHRQMARKLARGLLDVADALDEANDSLILTQIGETVALYFKIASELGTDLRTDEERDSQGARDIRQSYVDARTRTIEAQAKLITQLRAIIVERELGEPKETTVSAALRRECSALREALDETRKEIDRRGRMHVEEQERVAALRSDLAARERDSAAAFKKAGDALRSLVAEQARELESTREELRDVAARRDYLQEERDDAARKLGELRAVLDRSGA